jgi:hypothetical protein
LVIDQFLSVLSVGNLTASVISGVIGGVYFVAFLPRLGFQLPTATYKQISIVVTWFFTFLPSILYGARVAHAAVFDQSDLGRVLGGWTLYLLFCVFLGLGAYIGSIVVHKP